MVAIEGEKWWFQGAQRFRCEPVLLNDIIEQGCSLDEIQPTGCRPSALALAKKLDDPSWEALYGFYLQGGEFCQEAHAGLGIVFSDVESQFAQVLFAFRPPRP